jgi:hypothetical protein
MGVIRRCVIATTKRSELGADAFDEMSHLNTPRSKRMSVAIAESVYAAFLAENSVQIHLVGAYSTTTSRGGGVTSFMISIFCCFRYSMFRGITILLTSHSLSFVAFTDSITERKQRIGLLLRPKSSTAAIRHLVGARFRANRD